MSGGQCFPDKYKLWLNIISWSETLIQLRMFCFRWRKRKIVLFSVYCLSPAKTQCWQPFVDDRNYIIIITIITSHQPSLHKLPHSTICRSVAITPTITSKEENYFYSHWKIFQMYPRTWLLLAVLCLLPLLSHPTQILDRRKMKPCQFNPHCLCSNSGTPWSLINIR